MTFGRGTVFQPIFFFKPDFDQGMLACHDMFDMVSFTCLLCDMGMCRGRVWEVARLVANRPWRCDVTAPVKAQ